MRNLLLIPVLASFLSGCIMSGPMALLPPTAKFLMWAGEKDEQSDGGEAISVAELLKNVQGFDSTSAAPLNMQVSYSNHILSAQQLKELYPHRQASLEVACGPFEYGDPINAANQALRACSAIRRQLLENGYKVTVRFKPTAKKGLAIITATSMIEADDA